MPRSTARNSSAYGSRPRSTTGGSSSHTSLTTWKPIRNLAAPRPTGHDDHGNSDATPKIIHSNSRSSAPTGLHRSAERRGVGDPCAQGCAGALARLGSRQDNVVGAALLRSRTLDSHETIINVIGASTAITGLTVTAQLGTGDYPTGIKISDRENELPLTRERRARRNDPAPCTRHARHALT